MITLSAEEAGQAIGVGSLATPVVGVSVDSRTLRRDDLFVALKGETFDGHDYVLAAFEAGACGAVVAAGRELPGWSVIQSRGWAKLVYPVADPLVALGRLARAVRRRSRARVIGVTGSVGKTGTKDLIRAMAGMECMVLATESNLNNEVGVPLTLLQIEPSTELVVVEMGMRGLGQIAYLADITEPNVGVITNVAPVHLELLGTVENVAQAKAELLSRLTPDGVGVVPCWCPALEPWVERCGRKIVRFALLDDRLDQGPSWPPGLSCLAGVSSEDLVLGQAQACEGGRCLLRISWPGGQAETTTPFAARYRLENAVAAAAACFAAGLSLERCLEGLGSVVFTPGRGDEYEVGGLVILDHTYNANPEAVLAALQELVERASQVGGRAVAVLGDMLELGEQSRQYHLSVGERAAQLGVDLLFAVGDMAEVTVQGFRNYAQANREAYTVAADEIPDLSLRLRASLREGDVVLVKGSRRLRLERVIQGLLAEESRC